MGKLFQDESEPRTAPADAHVVGVAVNANLWRAFDYLWPDGFGPPAVGQRVRVPFGRGSRKTLGFVMDPLRRPGEHKLKAVAEVIDDQPRLDENLRRLGEWISQYYLTPPGMTLAAMIPSAVGRHAARTETVAYLQCEPDQWPPRLGSRQRKVLDELYEARKQGVEPLSLEELRRHSGGGADTIQRLRRRELVRLETREVVLENLREEVEPDPFELNEDQSAVLAALAGKLAGGFSATLLHGVTGSGKTEVYVRAIRQVVAAGRQAILLVPEIALAAQTLHRLLKRLPRVAVLHSGLTDAQRAFYYQQIAEGHAAVVVGPRSAVFAPARKLGLVIIDEEHEPSYKQDTAPRYHGRDVAVKRAHIEGVPVILGSATPSLESWHNAHRGRYGLLKLPRRVRSLPMPILQIVNLRTEMQPRRIELIGRTLTVKIAATLDRREQVILLMNRRGYASYVFCPSCQWQLMCPDCSRPMVFHQATQEAMCHYCEHTAGVPERCPACGGKIVYFGYGIQRVEDELARKFPAARVERMDSDTMTSPKQFRKVFDGFASGEVDILLGTQMVGKGLDFPKVSLVGVASGDTSLAIPDFRAAERTFQLIVQVAGRAGRGDHPGQVIVQTLHESEPTIQFAARHDYEGFAAWELPGRQAMGFPPFGRMVRFVARHKDVAKAREGAQMLARELMKLLPAGLARMMGPSECGLFKLREQFRFQVILVSPRPGAVQDCLMPRMEALTRDCPADLAVDVDPMNLM